MISPVVSKVNPSDLADLLVSARNNIGSHGLMVSDVEDPEGWLIIRRSDAVGPSCELSCGELWKIKPSIH
jgi:hypothetical protein